MKQKTWVLATNNVGKAKEFEVFLKEFAIEILTLKDIGFTDAIAETGASFKENSWLKAKAVSATTSHPVLADDSGLEVEALGGEPGIFSARYAGDQATDELNMQKLLDNLQGQKNRRARFVCNLAWVHTQGEEYNWQGYCNGTIAREAKGSNGFGYDPLFIPEGYQQTFGELGADIKKKLSHRAQAMQKLKLEWFKLPGVRQ